MKRKIYPVYIEFLDHQSQSNWQTPKELKDFKAALIYQVGWLVDEDKEVYKVAGQVSEDGDAGDVISILKKSVKRMVKFKLPK